MDAPKLEPRTLQQIINVLLASPEIPYYTNVYVIEPGPLYQRFDWYTLAPSDEVVTCRGIVLDKVYAGYRYGYSEELGMIVIESRPTAEPPKKLSMNVWLKFEMEDIISPHEAGSCFDNNPRKVAQAHTVGYLIDTAKSITLENAEWITND